MLINIIHFLQNTLVKILKNIFRPKLFSLLKIGISKNQISNDVMSGIVVGIVALPLAIAFAVASGVSPEKGLITAVIAGFIISLLGGSRVQIGGPTGAFIVIVYSILENYGPDGLIISTLLSGLLMIVFGIVKLGSLLKYFPQPLIVGFTSGIALIIFSTQIKDAIGLEIGKVPSEFIEKWHFYFNNIESFNIYSVIITLLTIIITINFKYLSKKIPGSFIAIVILTIIVQFFAIPIPTIETFFGEIPSGVKFSIPEINFANLKLYFTPALTIALLGSIESLLSAVVSDGMIGGNHRSNTELIAQGIANVITPFFGGIPATGAIARTATNVKNGGRTPIAGITHAFVLLLIMLFLGKWAKLIPMSVLAGVLIVVSYNMSEWRSFKSILKGSWFDSIVLLSTFILTVLIDLTVAIQVGVVLAALLFMKRMSDVAEKQIDIEIDTDLIDDYTKISEGIAIYEISGPLFFGSAKQYAEVLKTIGLSANILIIRMRHVPFIDTTGLNNFKSALKSIQNKQVKIILSGVNSNVFQSLEQGKIFEFFDKENVFDSFEKALKKAEEQN